MIQRSPRVWVCETSVMAAMQSVFVLSLGGQVGRKLMGWLPISYLYLVNILYAMLVLINLMGCTWLFVAETESPGESWLCNVGAPSNDSSCHDTRSACEL